MDRVAVDSDRPGAKTRQSPDAKTPRRSQSSHREVVERLRDGIATSCADATELVWIDSSRLSLGSHGRSTKVRSLGECTLLIRTLENGRLGSHRAVLTDDLSVRDAVRHAVAVARSRPASPLNGFAEPPERVEVDRSLHFDRALADLGVRRAKKLLGELGRRRERHALRWGTTDLVVLNSNGLEARTRVTGAALEVWSGRRMGAGRAAGAWRTLDTEAMQTVYDRARARDATGGISDLPQMPVPVVLSSEAAAKLWIMLHDAAFTASAYRPEGSLLREQMGSQVFGEQITLYDDGSHSGHLPFPLDFEGRSKQRTLLVDQGVPKTPVLDLRQAAIYGLQPTAHSVGGKDARAMHLGLESGDLSRRQTLEKAEGGLWVGWIDRVECFDTNSLGFRARASNVRVIRGGELADPTSDLIWEDNMLRVASETTALGAEVLDWCPDSLLGGWRGPEMIVPEVSGLVVSVSG